MPNLNLNAQLELWSKRNGKVFCGQAIPPPRSGSVQRGFSPRISDYSGFVFQRGCTNI